MADSRTLEILVKVKDLATKALGGIQGSVNKFAELAAKAFKAVAKGALFELGAQLLSIPGKLIAAGQAFLDEADQVQKLASALGTTTESLTAMTFAAEQSGLTQANLAADTKFLVKAIDEARNKAGEQRLIFQKLGIDVNALGDGQLDLVDIYAKLADGIGGVNDPVERSTILMKLLGKSGHEAALLLEEGSGGIRKLADDALKLGIVLEGGVVKNADRVGDALKSIQGFFRGLLFTVAKEVLPQIAKALEGLVEFLKEHREEVGRVMRGVGRVFIAVFDTVVTASLLWAGAVRVAFNSVLTVFKEVEVAFLKTKQGLQQGVADLERDTAIVRELARGSGAETVGFAGGLMALKAKKEQVDLTKQIAQAEKELAELVAGSSVPALVEYAAKWDVLKQAITGAGKELETFAGKAGGGGEVVAPDFFDGFKGGLEEFKENLEKTFDAGKRAALQFASGTQSALSGFFESIITGSANAKEALKQLGADFARILAKMVADYLAAQVVMQLFGLGGAPVGYGVPGGKIGPAPPPSAAGGRAGPLSFGGGRRGGGSSVLPPPGGLGGGGGAQVNITINAVDAEGLDRLLVRKRETLTNILINALAHRRDLIVDVRGA